MRRRFGVGTEESALCGETCGTTESVEVVGPFAFCEEFNLLEFDASWPCAESERGVVEEELREER